MRAKAEGGGWRAEGGAGQVRRKSETRAWKRPQKIMALQAVRVGSTLVCGGLASIDRETPKSPWTPAAAPPKLQNTGPEQAVLCNTDAAITSRLRAWLSSESRQSAAISICDGSLET